MNQSALRTLSVIELLAESGPCSLASIAERLGLNKSTAHRFTSTLVRAGYLEQRPGSRDYALTMKLVGLSSKVLDRLDVRRENHTVLEELAALTGETAHLAVTEGDEVVFIDKVQGGQAVEMASRIGARASCHSTGVGKVLLAARAVQDWHRYAERSGLPSRTPNTITQPARLYEELTTVAAQGYAIDDVENEQGIRCLAAPVRDHTGRAVAAMSVSGWVLSMTPERIEQLVPVVAGQAAKASQRLGHARPPQLEPVPHR